MPRKLYFHVTWEPGSLIVISFYPAGDNVTLYHMDTRTAIDELLEPITSQLWRIFSLSNAIGREQAATFLLCRGSVLNPKF